MTFSAQSLLLLLLALTAIACAHKGSTKPYHQGGVRPNHHKNKAFWAACRDDFEKYCKGTQLFQHDKPFESECLEGKDDHLTESCQKAKKEWYTSQGPILTLQKPSKPSNKEDDDDKEYNFGESCAADMRSICPDLPEDASPHDFFDSSCFKSTTKHLSESCKDYYEQWSVQRARIFAIMISSSFAMLVMGLFVCLGCIGCLACCVSRRRRRIRIARRRRATAKQADVEFQPMLGEQQYVYPMQTFSPPTASTATSPYSAYPQFYQPVLFFPPTPEQAQ